MPLIIPRELPAFQALEDENVFVMHKARAISQDIRPLRILLVNLMPTKIATETQIARVLANSPLQVQLTLLHLSLIHISSALPCTSRTTPLSPPWRSTWSRWPRRRNRPGVSS